MSVRAVAVEEDDLKLAAQSHVPVLITAEMTNEREISARGIHDNSVRNRGPFVTFDRDPSGADSAPAGSVDGCEGDLAALRRQFEQARGGTLFIDDISALTTTVQRQLFSLLDEPGTQIDAAAQPALSGVRIIAGASRPLDDALAASTFFEPLFYRLNVIHIDALTQPELTRVSSRRVRDLMSTPVCSCLPETDLAAVAKLMWDRDCGFVPVVDPSGEVVGAVTDRDICIAAATRQLLPERIAASQVMTAPVHTCLLDDTLTDALAIMRQFTVRRLPVVDAIGKLQGVLSLNDVVLSAEKTGAPTAAELIATLAAICSHRSAQTAVA